MSNLSQEVDRETNLQYAHERFFEGLSSEDRKVKRKKNIFDNEVYGEGTSIVDRRRIALSTKRRKPGDFSSDRNKDNSKRCNVWNFIPFTLLEQCERPPFIWSTIALIVTVWLQVKTPTVQLAQLLFAYVIGALMSWIADSKRGRLDNSVNSLMTKVLIDESTCRGVPFSKINEGDIVLVLEEESFPADVVLLATSNPRGYAYVDASGIDGSVYYTQKYSSQDTQASTEFPLNLEGELLVEKPNKDMLSFNATLRLKGRPRPERLSIKNFVMKHSFLVETEWALGLVIYTENESKLNIHCKSPPVYSVYDYKFLFPLVTYLVIAATVFILVLSIPSFIFNTKLYSLNYWGAEALNVRKNYNVSIIFSLANSQFLILLIFLPFLDFSMLIRTSIIEKKIRNERKMLDLPYKNPNPFTSNSPYALQSLALLDNLYIHDLSSLCKSQTRLSVILTPMHSFGLHQYLTEKPPELVGDEKDVLTVSNEEPSPEFYERLRLVDVEWNEMADSYQGVGYYQGDRVCKVLREARMSSRPSYPSHLLFSPLASPLTSSPWYHPMQFFDALEAGGSSSLSSSPFSVCEYWSPTHCRWISDMTIDKSLLPPEEVIPRVYSNDQSEPMPRSSVAWTTESLLKASKPDISDSSSSSSSDSESDEPGFQNAAGVPRRNRVKSASFDDLFLGNFLPRVSAAAAEIQKDLNKGRPVLLPAHSLWHEKTPIETEDTMGAEPSARLTSNKDLAQYLSFGDPRILDDCKFAYGHLTRELMRAMILTTRVNPFLELDGKEVKFELESLIARNSTRFYLPGSAGDACSRVTMNKSAALHISQLYNSDVEQKKIVSRLTSKKSTGVNHGERRLKRKKTVFLERTDKGKRRSEDIKNDQNRVQMTNSLHSVIEETLLGNKGKTDFFVLSEIKRGIGKKRTMVNARLPEGLGSRLDFQYLQTDFFGCKAPVEECNLKNLKNKFFVNRSVTWDSSLFPLLQLSSENTEEKCLVSAAAACGFLLVGRSFQVVTVIEQSIPHYYEMIHQGTTHGVYYGVVRNLENGIGKIYIRGPAKETLKLLQKSNLKLSDEEFESWNTKTRVLLRRGLQPIILGFKVLDADFLTSFAAKVENRNMGVEFEFTELDIFVQEMLENVQILGMCGLDTPLQTSAADVIKMSFEAKCAPWLLTSLKEEFVIPVAWKSGILKPATRIFDFRQKEFKSREESLIAAIKVLRLYEYQKKILSKQQNVAFIIDGETLNSYLDNGIAKAILSILAYSSGVLIGLELTATDRLLLTTEIKKDFHPQPVGFHIGGAPVAKGAMKSSNCSASLFNEGFVNCSNISAIAVQDWKVFKRLMFHESPNTLYHIWFFTCIIIYNVFFPGVLLLIYNLICHFQHPPKIIQGLLLESLLVPFYYIIPGFYKDPVSEQMHYACPYLYAINKSQFFTKKIVFFFLLLESIPQAA
eukprot:GHVP01057555.1.p1 GENE.GHVP01057555.1~~GHVP01057555.1.p1  ORF type:complete len:1439 (+),score=237.94 GHVP01057555.1:2868-7184(+)